MEIAVNAIYLAFAAIAVIGIFRGMRKGLYKSIADVVFVIIGAVLSFVIARLLSQTFTDVDRFNSFLETVKGYASRSGTIVGYINQIQDYVAQLAYNDNVINLALTIPVVIICPILFSLIYMLLGIILKIPKLIIERLVFGPNGGADYTGGSRIFGAAVGGVRNVLSFVIILIPVIGFINIPDAVIDASNDFIPPEESQSVSYTEKIDDINEQYVKQFSDNVILKTIYNCGGKWAFNSLSTVETEGVKVSLTEELCTIARLEADASWFYGVPIEQYGKEQSDRIEDIKIVLAETGLVPSLVAEGISYVSKTWLDGETVFGYEKINVGEYYEPTLDEILLILSSTDAQSLKSDISTLADIAKICIESELIKESVAEEGDIIGVVSDKDFMESVLLALYDNAKMRTLLEMGSNSIVNYIYKIYDVVNETTTAWGEQLDLDGVTREEMKKEAALLSEIIDRLNKFKASLETNGSDKKSVLTKSDLGSLGRALDCLRESIFFGNSYDFILEAILRSESCARLGFINDDFIEFILGNNVSLEQLFKTRQQIAIIELSLGEETTEDYKTAIELVLKSMNRESAEALKHTITPEAMLRFGMGEAEARAMASVLVSIIDEISEFGNDIDDEQLQNESDAIDKIVTVIKASGDSDVENMFLQDDGNESKTDISADAMVSSIMSSEIISSALKSSVKDENGMMIDDPYGMSSSVSSNDKQQISDSIREYYTQNQTEENSEQMQQTLSAIASVFGIDSENLF